jgi:hypothetical protein
MGSPRPTVVHLIGVVIASIVAIILLRTLIPYLSDLVFPISLRNTGVRAVSTYYLTIALIPVALWLIPPFLRFLARSTYAIHKTFVGKGGFYVRFLVPKKLRFRDTLLFALGPFALDLLVVAELTYLVSTPAARFLAEGVVLIPSLFLLAGLLTAFVPGHWLIDALDIRLIEPKKGQATRVAELFERFFGPVGAIALLAAFVTMLHSVNYSYEQGLMSLADWAVRLFPPVIAAVAFYRVVIQPRVVPELERWCASNGIPIVTSLDVALESVRPRGPLVRSQAGHDTGVASPSRQP